MADGNFMDKLTSMPKWLLVTLGVVLVGGLGYGMYYLAFGSQKKPDMVDSSSLTLDMPDAADNDYKKSNLEAYREGEYLARASRNPVDDYWNSLGGDLVSPGAAAEGSVGDMMDDLDPNEYSEAERRAIQKGLRTKAEIDAEHAKLRALEESLSRGNNNGGSSYSRPLTQAQKDSIQFARMEKAYEMAMRYQNPGVTAAQQPEPEEPAEEEEKKIDLENKLDVIPTESFNGDNIISSLDAPADNGTIVTPSGVVRRPVKATFLKNEKISSGERVIMRLMQDLTLSDGTVIPANTHITGTCSFSRRLKIKVSMLHYGNRMFATDLSVYDNDGTEGIYCPLAEETTKKNKKAKDIASGAVGAAGSVAGTLLTGNPFIGRVATSGISTITSSINNDGSISVNVSSGYEFYIYENVKEEKNGAR